MVNLILGHKYKLRNGGTSVIVEHRGGAYTGAYMFRVAGNAGTYTVTANGEQFVDETSARDLIEDLGPASGAHEGKVPTLKLKIGETYCTRNGRKVKIKSYKGDVSSTPYESDTGFCYAEDGHFYGLGAMDACDDIVSLWDVGTREFRIEIGRSYRLHKGGTVMLKGAVNNGQGIDAAGHPLYFVPEAAFWGQELDGQTPWWFRADGSSDRHAAVGAFGLDIIGEVAGPDNPACVPSSIGKAKSSAAKPKVITYRKRNATYPYGGWVQNEMDA